MGYLWIFYGFSMGFLWIFYGFSMDFLWIFYGLSDDFQMIFFGFSMDFLMDSTRGRRNSAVAWGGPQPSSLRWRGPRERPEGTPAGRMSLRGLAWGWVEMASDPVQK